MNKKTEESRIAYNKIAFEYDTSREGQYTRFHINELSNMIDLREGDIVLDIACGNGTLLRELSKKVKIQANGIDVSENMIHVAKLRYPDMNFEVKPCYPLEWKDESIDIITICCAYIWYTKVNWEIRKERYKEQYMADNEILNSTAVDAGNEYDASEIQVLEGLEAVRKRPGMYIGSTSASGLHHLVYEIVDNAIDEALAGYCTDILVQVNEDNTITVVDNGRGIPVDIQAQTGKPALEVVFTILHAGGKFGGGGYKVSGGLHGVGASVVNALSEWLTVQVHKDGKIHEMKFSRGHVTQEMTVVGSTDRTGTTVSFKPDPEMFEETVYNYETLHTRMQEEAFLNAGLRIRTVDRRPGREQEDSMCYEGGIREFVTWLNKSKDALHNGVIYMAGQKDDSMAEVALQYNDGYNETILSFANNVHTPEGGMHEEGFKRALTTVLNSYGRKIKMLKDDEKVSGEDCREGLTCVISVKLTEAQFEGQTKAKLGNSEIRTLVNNIVSEKLDIFLEENPQVGRMILDKALTANRAREAAKKARESIRRKTALGGAAMPDKLRDCNENNPELTEIYIVEGDSAGGSATQGRDSRFQAILPLWGKMLNVEKARADKVYGNDKLQPVITALGAGIGEEFDSGKLRYHKVIIMADADVDGSHIRTLLLTFFFRFMRPLIEQGYVYSAVPPLFKLTRGKTTRLAFSEEERDAISAELRGDNPNAKVDISRFKGLGEMNPHELWETTMDPERRTLRRITLDDAVKADEIFTILMGEKVEPRKEFIEQNAQYAVNLDY